MCKLDQHAVKQYLQNILNTKSKKKKNRVLYLKNTPLSFSALMVIKL